MSTKNYPTWGDLMIIIGVYLVAAVVLGLLVGVLMHFGVISQDLGYFLGTVLAMGAACAIGLMQRKNNKREPLLNWGWNRINLPVLLWGYLLILAMSTVIEPFLLLLPDIGMEMLRETVKGGWMIVAAIVFAPVLEEVLFRGVIQQSLTEKYGSWRGILIAAGVFGVIHIIPVQAVNAFFIGIILGYIYYLTGSLANVIILHAINNGISALLMKSLPADKLLLTTRDMITNNTLYLIVYILAVAIVAISVWAILREVKKREILLNKVEAADGEKPEE